MKTYMRAFTLIELMVTIAVLAVVLVIAMPSFNRQINNNRADSAADEFTAALNYARSQAVRTKQRVSLCASSDGQTCTGSDWAVGLMVFEDRATSDNAATPILGSSAKIYKVWQKFDSVTAFSVKRGSTNVGFVRFTSLGTLALSSADSAEATIKPVGCTGNSAKIISISLSGFISKRPHSC